MFPNHQIISTCTERRLPSPAPIRLAGPVLWSCGQVKSGLARIDQCVAKGWQFNGPHVRLGRQLWLAAVVSCRHKMETGVGWTTEIRHLKQRGRSEWGPQKWEAWMEMNWWFFKCAYRCTPAEIHSKWGWADMCEKWIPAVGNLFCSWRTPCCWSGSHAQGRENTIENNPSL